MTVGGKAPVRLGSANMSLNDESWRRGPGCFRNTMSTSPPHASDPLNRSVVLTSDEGFETPAEFEWKGHVSSN